MRLKRRNTTLIFANTCAGTRFPMHLSGRCAWYRWNNPSLHNGRRQTVRALKPNFMDAFLDEQPLKRVYRGFLSSGRFSRFPMRERPTVVKGSSFLQAFETVADRIGRGPKPLSLSDL